MTTTPILPLSDRDRARFWSKVDRRGPDECWPWIGCAGPRGYGQFSRGLSMVRAHRVAWALANGRDPGALHACHRCDNPQCVNPSHIWLGTHRDNMSDMVAKRRGGKANAAKSSCPQGHEYTPENTYTHAGARHCRACMAERDRRRRADGYWLGYSERKSA